MELNTMQVAVSVEVKSTVSTQLGMQSNITQPVGGIQIAHSVGSDQSFSSCTLGVVTIIGGQEGFLTNSHCSTQLRPFDGVNTPYLFGNRPDGAIVVTESIDPPVLNGVSGEGTTGCEESELPCRRSDVAFVPFASGFTMPKGFRANAPDLECLRRSVYDERHRSKTPLNGAGCDPRIDI